MDSTKWRCAIATGWNEESSHVLSVKQLLNLIGRNAGEVVDQQMSFPGDILYGVFDGDRYVWSGKDPFRLAAWFRVTDPIIPETDRFWVPPSIQAMLDARYDVAEELKDV
jgi:hypothetical protein